ncbi:MAG: hypothetical protein ACR2MZ_00945 [Candidatus Dormibacter sp.]|uniref:hypothetical protein n=1 Tax=Candidatus Dormibacter sp. TaxID=2973982 RepID=UPI003D9BA354
MPAANSRSTFEAEIRQQPEVVAAALAAGNAPIAEAAQAIRARHPAALLIAARGSSDHAALPFFMDAGGAGMAFMLAAEDGSGGRSPCSVSPSS